MKNKIILTIALAFVLFNISSISAGLVLDSVQFDPAIISAGDHVDVVVQYHYSFSGENDRIGNPEYKFKVSLEKDSSLSDEYITIEDSDGDGYGKTIYAGEYGTHYNEVFNIKIDEGAKTGIYEFNLVGQWYKNGRPLGGETRKDFELEVKKEGISLDIINLKTTPSKVRAGNNYVELLTEIHNSGEKETKSVQITPIFPEGFDHSYSNNNYIGIGKILPGESKEVSLFLDLDEKVDSGTHNISYKLDYYDDSNNKYSKIITKPFFVAERPYIIVKESYGTVVQGKNSELHIILKNTGNQSSEATDVRIIKQSSQPFELQERSKYIGKIKPQEEVEVVFDIKAKSDAYSKEHYLNLLVRAKGDSDEGDDSIYTYNRRANILVKKRIANPFLVLGLSGLVGLGFFMFQKKRKTKWKIKNYIRVIAGSMIFVSVILTYYFSAYWLLLSLFVGLNLIQSSFTNWCFLEDILGKKLGIKN